MLTFVDRFFIGFTALMQLLILFQLLRIERVLRIAVYLTGGPQ